MTFGGRSVLRNSVALSVAVLVVWSAAASLIRDCPSLNDHENQHEHETHREIPIKKAASAPLEDAVFHCARPILHSLPAGAVDSSPQFSFVQGAQLEERFMDKAPGLPYLHRQLWRNVLFRKMLTFSLYRDLAHHLSSLR